MLLAIFITGCASQVCVQSCNDDADFWDACYDTFVENGLEVVCYDNVDGLGVELAAAGTDPAARQQVYQSWAEAGMSYPCEDADEVQRDCVQRVRAEFSNLSGADSAARAQQCIPSPNANDPADIAFRERDCEGYMRAIGLL